MNFLACALCGTKKVEDAVPPPPDASAPRAASPPDASAPRAASPPDAGCTFFDTADCYCADGGDTHYAERLLARALGDAAGSVVVSTKGGNRRGGGASKSWAFGHRIAAAENELSFFATQAFKPRKPNAAKSNKAGVVAACAAAGVALHRHPAGFVALAGTRRADRVPDVAAVEDLILAPADYDAIDAIKAPQGRR
ncbi:oxidoreductase [Aureococcus anophagefferens]|nr:oxidoreductase [Aureococcus anophagefferens]